MGEDRNAAISTIVRVLLAAHGRTQLELARHLDVSEATLTRRLQGTAKRPWRIDELDDVASFFNIDVRVLVKSHSQLLEDIARLPNEATRPLRPPRETANGPPQPLEP